MDNGAKCIFLPKEKVPLMVQKSDGGFNYDTTDLAAIKYRIEEQKAEWIIYITDSGQANHFKLVFKAAELVGILDPSKIKVDHIGFGLVMKESEVDEEEEKKLVNDQSKPKKEKQAKH